MDLQLVDVGLRGNWLLPPAARPVGALLTLQVCPSCQWQAVVRPLKKVTSLNSQLLSVL